MKKSSAAEKEPSKCMVLMRFHEPQAQELYERTIVPVVRATRLTPIRLDSLAAQELSVSGLLEAIGQASVAIVDVSKLHPNTAYELGICDAVQTPTILISMGAPRVPFDLARRHVFRFDMSPSGLANLRLHLKHAIRDLTSSQRTKKRVPPGPAFRDAGGGRCNQARRLLEDIETAKSRVEKGWLFEDLVASLLGRVPGLEVIERRRQTHSGDIDLVLWNDAKESPYDLLSSPILVECKNRSSKVGTPDISQLLAKLGSTSARVGLLVSRSGFTRQARQLVQEAANQGLVLVLLDDGDLRDLMSDSYREAFSEKIKRSMIGIL